MSTDDLYEFTVEWPSASPQTVIVTGDFDKWSRSLQLSRTSTGIFSTTVKVPYGCPTRYKFIVDGEWKVSEGNPTERTPEGYINNIHYVPLEKPSSDPTQAANGNGTAAPSPGAASNGKPREQDAQSTQTSAVPQFLSDLAKTIAARDGTSSALGYVASGIGATIHSVVGVDPINSNQIPIPTPTSPEPSTGLPSLMDSQSVPDVRTPQSSVAPIVPITIVPVYAKENCTIDPTRTAPEDGSSNFVGVGSLRAREDTEEQETGEAEGTRPVHREMGISTHAPVVPPINVIVASAPSPTLSATPVAEKRAPASAPTATVEKRQVEEREEEVAISVPKEESNVVADTPAVTPEIVEVKLEEEALAQDGKEGKEESAAVAKAVVSAPEPSQIPLPPTPAKPLVSDSTDDANGHHRSPSATTDTTITRATSTTSRPSTPTPAAAPSSTASTPHSTTKKRKIFPQLGNGSPSKNKEEGSGTTGSGRKKRTSSIFGKLSLKNLFHHHDKKDAQSENLDSQ